MKNRVILLIIGVLLFSSCSKRIYTPVQTEVKEKIIEKVVVDTIEIPLPVEKIVVMNPQFDTSIVETSLAKSVAFIDTSANVINHSIENKEIDLPIKIEYKEKETIVEVEKEVPVEVEVVKYKRDKLFWLSLLLNAVFLVFLSKKFKLI